jgi:L-alanine-DL-glutamate epimerase-like enolase superfamily enzyme
MKMMGRRLAGHPGLTGVALDLSITRVQAHVYRCPAGRAIRTSFGAMQDRQTVLVRIEDAAGHEGWGEVWCNFPPGGAEHRAVLLRDVVGPLLMAAQYTNPCDAFRALEQKTHILALQCGEGGPFAQVVAAVDMACWDLVARRANAPLWQLLGGSATVPAYASGLEAPDYVEVALAKWEEGYRAFKLKVGFDREQDIANVRKLRDALPASARLMVDANQGWTLQQALERTAELHDHGVQWLEEPLACDRPHEEWRTLARQSPVPLAAGENLRGNEVFDDVLVQDYLGVFQPDMGKWGGFSGAYAVGARALQAGRIFCPHWLSGGVGQMASMHLLSAVGGAGLLEVDSKSNPLRENLGLDFSVADGMIRLPMTVGVTGGLDISRIERHRVAA